VSLIQHEVQGELVGVDRVGERLPDRPALLVRRRDVLEASELWLAFQRVLDVAAGEQRTLGDMAAAAIESLFWGNEAFDVAPDPGAVVLWFSDDPSLNKQTFNRLRQASEKQLGLRGRIAVRAVRSAIDLADGGKFVELADIDVARCGAWLRHLAIRDAAWLEVDQRGGAGDELWLDLARRLPSPYDAAPLFLYGWSVWRRGNGALAGMASQRAITSDSNYTPGKLLLTALEHGLRPDGLALRGGTPDNSSA
jgi:hypothetical protein